MGDTLFYQYIDRLSLFYNYFAFLDTDAYLADQLFIKHQVRVHFCEEYVRGDSPYRVIFCHVRKRDRARFQAALEEVNRLKPSSAKGRYISKATVATTFGPGIPVDPAAVAA